jgi:phage shock protein PspC (stress-responsive transcriptional regulator)
MLLPCGGIARKWVLDLTLSNLLLSATIKMLLLVWDLSVYDQMTS